jgi:hypothetical protein
MRRRSRSRFAAIADEAAELHQWGGRSRRVDRLWP